MKNFIIIILLIVVAALIGFDVMESRNKAANTQQVATSTNDTQVTPPAALSISSVTEQQITLSSGTVISINDFADLITVAEDTKFGSSDKIKAANLSPDKKHLSIAVAGAAHDFGWIYEVDSKELFPVVFQYGGSVELAGWKTSSQVAFSVTTPEPKTVEKVIDLNNLDEYPKVE